MLQTESLSVGATSVSSLAIISRFLTRFIRSVASGKPPLIVRAYFRTATAAATERRSRIEGVNLRELETLNEETICSYVRHQEHRDCNLDQKEFDFE